MRNIKLTIEYDGTKYCGWQRQNHSVTVQGTIESAIKELTKEDIEIFGCSRTDTGVHARGYIANFNTISRIPAEKFFLALNHKLPKDIRIIKSEEVSEEFHSRFNSKGKIYCYTIFNREVASAIYRNSTCHVQKNLDVEAMRCAAECIVGTHDFNAFRNVGSSVSTTVRTVYSIKIDKINELIKIYVSGDGFLYNMVRIISGTLIEVGLGNKSPEDISNIILSKNRGLAGRTAPAQGLSLEEVFYD